jgi:hypothetical protein
VETVTHDNLRRGGLLKQFCMSTRSDKHNHFLLALLFQAVNQQKVTAHMAFSVIIPVPG